MIPPTLGATAPDFTLPAHTGESITLSTRPTPKAHLLIFYRGHWCPYCRRYLAKLVAAHQRLTDLGASLLAISPEPPNTSAGLARELNIPFPLLSDIDCQTIEAYGVRNNFTGATPFLPHPAIFILTPNQSIHYKSIDRNYKKRTPIPTLYKTLEALPS